MEKQIFRWGHVMEKNNSIHSSLDVEALKKIYVFLNYREKQFFLEKLEKTLDCFFEKKYRMQILREIKK